MKLQHIFFAPTFVESGKIVSFGGGLLFSQISFSKKILYLWFFVVKFWVWKLPTWSCSGSDRETLMTLYKATSRSVINYCCSTWAPIIKDCHWKRLQLAQKKALRITTGCYNMTNIDDLHNEARVLPIKEHTHMLAKHTPSLATTRGTPVTLWPQDLSRTDLRWNLTFSTNIKTSYRIEELKIKKPKDFKKSYTHRPSTKSAAVWDRTLFTEAHLLKYTKMKVHYQGSAEHAWHNSETDLSYFKFLYVKNRRKKWRYLPKLQ